MWYEQAWFYIIIMLVAFGLVALIAFIIRYFLNRKKPVEKKSEEEIAQEELERILEPIPEDQLKNQTNDTETMIERIEEQEKADEAEDQKAKHE